MTRTLIRTGPGRPTTLAQEGRPFVSVIVPARNEAPFIRGTLEQLLEQDYPADRFEVIVADGQSTDATRLIVLDMQRQHAHLRLLNNPQRWSSSGRNQAIQAARGDILVIVDGHCELDGKGWLQELVQAFERSGADSVGRPQPLDVSNATPVQRAIAVARASSLGHHPDSFIYSAGEQFVRPQSVAVAYRREVFEKVGLFDESFDACEDVEFNQRVDEAGLNCFFTPAVRVRYFPRASLLGLFRQMVRYGRGRVRLVRKHPETFTLPGFVPALFLIGLIAGAGLACVSVWLGLIYAATLGLYGAIVGITSVSLAGKQRELRLLPWLPLVFAAIHLGAGTGIVLEAIVGQRRRAAAPAFAAEGLTPVLEEEQSLAA